MLLEFFRSFNASQWGWGGLQYETDGMLVVSLRGVNLGFWS